MRSSNLKIIKSIIKKFGRDESVVKIEEECLELALAIHQLNCPTKTDKKKRLQDVYEEIADVKISIRKAEMLFNKKKINRIVNQKLQKKKKKYNL